MQFDVGLDCGQSKNAFDRDLGHATFDQTKPLERQAIGRNIHLHRNETFEACSPRCSGDRLSSNGELTAHECLTRQGRRLLHQTDQGNRGNGLLLRWQRHIGLAYFQIPSSQIDAISGMHDCVRDTNASKGKTQSGTGCRGSIGSRWMIGSKKRLYGFFDIGCARLDVNDRFCTANGNSAKILVVRCKPDQIQFRFNLSDFDQFSPFIVDQTQPADFDRTKPPPFDSN